MQKMDLDLIFQVCICTNDMETLLGKWRQLFNLDESSIICKNTKDIWDRGEYHGCNYNGEPCEFFHKYYRLNMGGMDLEIIEPITKDNHNPYTDFLAQDGNGIHHLGVKFRDRSKLVDNMKELGIVPSNYGFMGPKDQPVESRPDCYFYDLRKQLGVIFEAGGAVVGPLASDPRAGSNSTAGQLNSFAKKPELPEVTPLDGIEKLDIETLYQIAVCAEDGEAVLACWKDWFNLEDSEVCRFDQKDYKLIRLEIGGMDFAIIEPKSKEAGTPYADYLLANGINGIHHIAVKVADYDKLVSTMEKLGYANLADVSSGISEDGAAVRSVSYDLRADFGVVLEATDKMVGCLTVKPRG